MLRLLFVAVIVALPALSFGGSALPGPSPLLSAQVQPSAVGWGETPCLPPKAREEARASARQQSSYVPGVLIVQVLPGVEEAQAQALAQAVGGKLHCRFRDWDIYLVQVAPGGEAEALARLREHPQVAAAQRDRLLRALATPNDARFAQQWALTKINAPAAWDISTGSSEVIIAIVDTGVDLTHPDLQSKIVLPHNVADGSANAVDDVGHGTHVAGIAAAAANNGAGIAGVAWGARIMPVRLQDSKGEIDETAMANGITYAVDKGAKIINLSIGAPEPNVVLEQAVKYAIGKGALLVAAAGNCFNGGPEAECGGKINPPMYPAAYPYAELLAVGGIGSQDEHADYSETGDYVDLAAPGGNPSGATDPAQGILSTALRSRNASGYEVLAGTSQAAPHVSGVAALVWSVNPALTNTQVAQILLAAAADLGPSGKDPSFGAGRVDALKSLQMARAMAQAPAPTSPEAGVTLSTMGTVLRWTQPPATTQYQVQVIPANNDGPAINLIIGDPALVASASFTVQAPVLGVGNYVMLPGMSYTWRVRATAKPTFAPENDPLWGPWSPARSFRTPAPSSAGLRLASPGDGATVASIAPQGLRWEHSDRGLFYWEVQVSGDARFDSDPATATSFVWWNLVHGGVTTSFNTWATPPLAAKATYFWRVRPRVQGDGTPVDWGPTWSFRTP